jgi:type IV pilus assembly protein PilO
MSMSDRDKKILIAVVPIIVIVAYWFLLLAPKREEASTAGTALTKQEERRDAAQSELSQAAQAETDFAADYGEIVRLGKAIPAQVDMPSLIVQLDSAAEGTGIRFTKIATGERQAVTPPAPAEGESSSDSETTPTDAGGETAESGPGSATEAANTTAAASDQRASAAEASGVDATTSTSSGEGLPVGGGAATPGAEGAVPTGSPAGLETVPLELEFVGNFFNLADFFHDVKRFVHVVNDNVVVNGRLVTVDSVNYASDPTLFPKIKATLTATIYLAPKAEGTTAGATPQGPAATTPAAAPAPTDGGTAPTAPTAAATP